MKISLRKVTRIVIWLAIGSGIAMLLLAAIRNQKNGLCAGYEIKIQGAARNRFVQQADIEKLLTKTVGTKIESQPKAMVDLSKLKQLILKNSWIKTADVYFDNKDILHINIDERSPIARVFTTAGNSFYMDNDGLRMPVSMGVTARVPVFTGFSDRQKLTKNDSVLLEGIKDVSGYIINDDFWLAQVAQIDIDSSQAMEMIPTVGNHIVKLGSATNVEAKFKRLYIFYKNVLAKAGFDKYKTINLAFAGQVIADKTGEQPIDKKQLAASLRNMMDKGSRIPTEPAIPVSPILARPGDEAKTEDTRLLNSPKPTAVNKKENNKTIAPKAKAIMKRVERKNE